MGAEQLKPTLTRTPGNDHGQENGYERIIAVDHYSRSDWSRGMDVSQAVDIRQVAL